MHKIHISYTCYHHLSDTYEITKIENMEYHTYSTVYPYGQQLQFINSQI